MKIAVIPARGGSKRIPRKNIREFAGKPLMVYSIEMAQRSGLFDRIIVSTDDREIASVAEEFDAEVPFVRPPELADNYTGTTKVVAHAINWLRGEGETDISAVCCIYPTAPFIEREDLQTGLSRLETGKWQYVFSAANFPSSIFRSFLMNDVGELEMIFPEKFDVRSQDLPEALHDAGQFYWGLPDAWIGNVRLFSENSTTVLVPRWRVQDIDTEEDWRSAERIFMRLSQEQEN